MHKPRVRIVEDEHDIAGLIKHALERRQDGGRNLRQRRCRAAGGGGARPDLVILDLNLPVLNGLEVCRILRGRAS